MAWYDLGLPYYNLAPYTIVIVTYLYTD